MEMVGGLLIHRLPPCCVRRIPAQEEHHFCQLECWRVWKRWRHRVVGGEACVSGVAHVQLCGSANALPGFQGYMSSIGQKVVTYISLDGVVMGRYRSERQILASPERFEPLPPPLLLTR